MTDTLILSEGNTRLELRPSYGGRISRLVFDGWDVLCPIPEQENDVWQGYKGGSFPLVPFSNRIKNATFAFDEKDIQLEPHPNEPGHALHGHGCFSKWSVEDRSDNKAVISYHHRADGMGWPWSYSATQEFTIRQGECHVRINVSNLSGAAMPLGFGFHPFFPFDDDVRLKFDCDAEWIGSPEVFPTERQNLTHDFNASAGRNLWRDTKTVCFDGFKGEAEIHWLNTNRRLALKSDALLNHFIVHVPNGAKYFCLEPVCHPTDGFNLSAQKIINTPVLTINAGRTVSTSMTFKEA